VMWARLESIGQYIAHAALEASLQVESLCSIHWRALHKLPQ